MGANPGDYLGYSPSKNLPGGVKYCTNSQENDEIASLP